jgi:butyryl-CoA dehydrogenase
MMHMMNEARIGIGMAATMLGYAGFEASLEYAKNRPQGRHIDGAAKGVRAVETINADVMKLILLGIAPARMAGAYK